MKSTREELEDLIGFTPPKALVQLVDAFGGGPGKFENGIKLLEDNLNLGSGIGHCKVGRGYENTPVEFFPFMYTGGGGESYGYVIAAPELELPDYPLADFVPGGWDGLTHMGNSTRDAVENVISYMHAHNSFAEVDLGLLKRMGLAPSADKAQNVGLLDGENYVRPMPEVPDGWQHLMTSDGAGVLAEAGRFRPGKTEEWTSDSTLKEILAAVKRDQKYPATVLYHLKEAWWWTYHDMDKVQLVDLKKRRVDVYRQLGKTKLADVMLEYFDWVE